MSKEQYVTINHIGEKVKVSLIGTLIEVDAGGAYYVVLDDCEDEMFQIKDHKDIQLVTEKE